MNKKLYLFASIILVALWFFYLYKKILLINTGNNKFMLKYKSGFDWGEKIIDISNGNFSTMTLSDGNTIETVLFDNYFLVNLINKKGKVIAFIKQNL